MQNTREETCNHGMITSCRLNRQLASGLSIEKYQENIIPKQQEIIYCLKCNCILLQSSGIQAEKDGCCNFSDWTVNSKFKNEAVEIHPIELYEQMLTQMLKEDALFNLKCPSSESINQRNHDIFRIFDVCKKLKLEKLTIHIATSIYDILNKRHQNSFFEKAKN